MSNKIYYTLLMSINILLSISCTQQDVEEEHGILGMKNMKINIQTNKNEISAKGDTVDLEYSNDLRGGAIGLVEFPYVDNWKNVDLYSIVNKDSYWDNIKEEYKNDSVIFKISRTKDLSDPAEGFLLKDNGRIVIPQNKTTKKRCFLFFIQTETCTGQTRFLQLDK